MPDQSPLSNVQLELLKLYSTSLSEKDILELKDVLARFYAEKSIELADNAWQQKGYTAEDMNSILNDDGQ
ncbi:MAG TPA: hypothetical protein VJ111_08110 [Chitinophagaceae bacterium]|nr:hypothetical protein [Chitinophagaceae bacterium]